MTDVRTATTAQRVSLRPTTPEDRAFLLEVYGSTRDQELSQVEWAPGQRAAFLQMQFDAQDSQYRQHNPDGSFDVIEVDGTPAGRLYVDRRPGDLRVVDISLLPQFRGLGVGGWLLRGLMDEAASEGRIVSVHVEIHNPAAGLYSRLGFEVAAERGVYRRMEWRSP